MGFFDDIFDFNQDGETDLGEIWLGHMIFNECMKEEEEEKESSYVSYHKPTVSENYNYCWRLDSDLDNDYGIDPYCFSTKEEFQKALKNAELIAAARLFSPEEVVDCGGIPLYYLDENADDDDWRLDAELEEDSDLDPYDFDTEEEYLEALEDFE